MYLATLKLYVTIYITLYFIRYDDCLGVSRYVGIMRGALFGGSLGVMLGCTFWIISLANYYGIKLMSEAAARGSNEYSGGEIIFVRANYCKHKIKVGRRHLLPTKFHAGLASQVLFLRSNTL